MTPPDRRVAIVAAASPESLAAVRALVEEYQRSLGVDLEFQGFSHELTHLGEMYGPPGGALFLATVEGAPVGCVGVRRFDGRCSEMKRLYVRPSCRGLGLGRRLAQCAMDAARAAGYLTMRLDTLPSMHDAQALYERLGFHDVPPYRANPVAGTRFLEATL